MKIKETALGRYLNEIDKGKILVGRELYQELLNLKQDIETKKYIYDTKKAEERFDFLEHCIRLTKSPFFGQPMKLMLWQRAFIEILYSFKMADGTDRFQTALLMIARKNTKALALDTRIPTPNGDKIIADIQPGDKVYSKNGKSVKVLSVSPIFKERECYEVAFEDDERIIADAEHKWTVQTKECRKIKKYIPKSQRKRNTYPLIDNNECIVLTTKQMLNDFKKERKDKKGIEYKYRVPMALPLERPENKSLFSPYCLGLWLGDGDKNDTRLAVGKEDLEELVKQLKNENIKIGSIKEFKGKFEVRLGEKYYVKKSKNSTGRNTIREKLRELGVFKNKHIPTVYLQSSINQRLALLQGLMDTDGACSKKGQCRFTQKNEQLANDFSKLLTSLGIKHTMKKIDAKCNGKDCGKVFDITFFCSKNFSCFRYERKKQRLKERLASRMQFKSIINIRRAKNQDTKCITVNSEDGLFLCGEKNTVTHNSELSSALALTEMIIGGEGLDIVCSSNDDLQANILYQAVNTMRLQIDPKQEATWINQQGMKCFLNNNRMFKLSDRTRNKEGRNIDYAFIDEIHEMKNKDIIKAIEQSQSLKINPKLIMITTEGFVNGGVLDNELIRARQIINKEVDDKASQRYLPFLYTQDDEAEVWQGNRDNRLWEKSNPSLGIVKKYEYLEKQVDLARGSKTDRVFVLCKDFNIHQNTAEAWLRREVYQDIQEIDLKELEGTVAIGGVDIAETTDLSCASCLVVKNKDKYIKTMYWIPAKKLESDKDLSSGARYQEWAEKGLLRIVEGNFMQPSLIADWFAELYKTYRIKPYKIGYDVRFSNEFVNKAEEYGFETELIYQKPQVLSDPISMYESDLEEGQVKGLSEVDKWCLGNATLTVDSKGYGLLEKIKGQNSKKIDGAVATVIAYEVYRRNMTLIDLNNT